MAEQKREICFCGIPISGGVIVGNAQIVQSAFRKREMSYKINEFDIPQEIGRVKEALQVLLLVNEYSERFLLRYFGPAVAELFEAQRMLLEDKHFRQGIFDVIELKRYKAETAVRITLDKIKHSLLESESHYLRERISDINDLKKSFIDALINPVALFDESRFESNGKPDGRKHNVVIMKELLPRLVIEQKMEGASAIIAEHGGKTSHAAILCRAFGIPAVSGIKNIHNVVSYGSRIVVNGNSGEVIINPVEVTIQQVQVVSPPKTMVRPVKSVRKSGNGFKIMANINFATEVSDAREFYADGIGLYRTEFEFMAAGRFLDEEDQYVRYKSVIKAMKGLPVYIRLLDLGRDKRVDDHDFSAGNLTQENSFGAQFLLNNPEVLKTQAKAIARASEFGPVSVSYPMISGLNQFVGLKEIFNDSVSGVNYKNIKHGVMLELPSACMSAGLILRVADFGCIGTNDLISYLFGIKRDSHSDALQEAAEHPMLWKLIKGMAKSALSQNKPLLFCGELAKNPKCIEKLITLGINSISVTPKLIPQLKNEVNDIYHKNYVQVDKVVPKRGLLVT